MNRQTARRVLEVGATALLALGLVPGVCAAAAGPAPTVDVGRSKVTVRVYKSGMFAAFAHDHLIEAPIQRAEITTSDPPSVEVEFDSRTLKVEDPGGSTNERETVQRNMLGPEVLDSQQYPEIRFRSTRVQAEAPGKWEVQGQLTLHGQTQAVSFEVSQDANGYSGTARLRQTRFGITPIRIAGGTVKVKDEVVVEFEIATQ